MTQLDLNNLSARTNVTVTVAREESHAERIVRLGKEIAISLFALVVGAVVVWLCVRSLISADANAEEKKWAMSVLAAIGGGVVGFLLPRR